MNFVKAAPMAGASLFLLAACSEPAPAAREQAAATPPGIAVNPPSLDIPPITASVSPLAKAIDQAAWSGEAMTPDTKRNALMRAQVLLARARFSPGVIDGQGGDNMKDALMGYEVANNLPVDGELDAQVWELLVKDTQPVVTDYTITAEDVAGPFLEKIPANYQEMAKLERLGFTSPLEALSEKFHMDEKVLAALNPGADFATAGTTIVVAALGADKLSTAVTLVEVDKAKRQVRAFAADGKLLASYPATIGSSDTPTPAGEWAVTTATFDPVWNYDPAKLNFGDKKAGKLTIKPGPNNPVGAVWIDLTKDTYGIHGAPDPRMVGKSASHGCVRLTNWDARQLAGAVSKGTKVVFLGADEPAKAKTKV